MFLAAWVKRRQFEKGFEKGFEIGREIGHAQGRAEVRKLYNARLRAFAKEYGIPEGELPYSNETDQQ